MKEYRVEPVKLRVSSVALEKYLWGEILPRYFHLDAGHNQNHIYKVLENAYRLNEKIRTKVDENLLTTAVLYHDVGITGADSNGRERHHLVAAEEVREDGRLREWFSEPEIEEIAVACLQHRASFRGKRERMLAKIVADADTMDAYNFERTFAYVNSDWLPEGAVEEKLKLMYGHYLDKFSSQGYASFELPEAMELTREFRERLEQIGGSFETYRDYLLKHYREWLE